MGRSAYAGTGKPVEKESNHLNSIANGSFYLFFPRDENKSKKIFWHIPLGAMDESPGSMTTVGGGSPLR